MFITPDEHIIIMEDLYTPFDLDDLHKLEDAGIKTIYLTHPFCWEKVYRKSAPAVPVWQSVNEVLDRYARVPHLKLLMPFYYTMPNWFPDSWYLFKHPTMPDHHIPNYANPDFVSYLDMFLNNALDQFFVLQNRVQITYAIPAGGEFLWDANQVAPFPVHPDEIIKFVVGRQKLLATQHNEIWTVFHNFLGDPMNWNNTELPNLYDELAKGFPTVNRYSIQGAHFSVGNSYFTDKEKQMKVKTYKEKYGVKFFVGSNYCEGLVTNFDAAIEQGVQGFLTAPLHLENPNHPKHIEPWMVDAIKTANKRFQEIYDGSN